MSKGIDVRATTSELLFRVLLQDFAGAILVTGTTSLRLYELQMSDGTLKSYDFNDNTFKTGTLTTETLAMTARTGNNGATNTGLWTARLATLTGFTVGNIYFAHVTNTGASPVVQVREFQFGSEQGDLVLSGNFLEVDVEQWKTGTVPTPNVTGEPLSDVSHWRGTQPSTLNNNLVQADVERWLNGAIPAVNVTGVPKVDLIDWLGSTPNALVNSDIPADVKQWLGSVPASLSTNGYVQAMLLRWLTDNVGGTPDALSSGKLPADLKLWLATAPLALSSQLVQVIVNDYASGKVPLQPTVAGRTLDVSAGGEAGLDWANIGSPTTVEGLTGTTIKAVTDAVTIGNVTLAASQPNYVPAKQSDILSDATPFAGATIGTINTNISSLLSRIGAFTGSGVNTLLGFLRAMANKAVGVTTPTDLSSGGTFDNTADSLEAIADQSDADVWTTALPNGYSAGQAGYILGNLSATVFPAGAIEVTFVVKNSVTHLPLSGARVWFSTDAIGVNVIWSGVTNASGIAINVNNEQPFLNAGTYFAWVQDARYTDTNPTTIVVS